MSKLAKHLSGPAGWAGLCLIVAVSAVAQPEQVTMPAEKVSPTIVPAEGPAAAKVAGVSHRCGGISSDESTAMRAQMKAHPLSLLFAQAGGAYIADVDVEIQSAQKAPVMKFRAAGPVCLIDLPPGSYTVAATSAGVTKDQAVTVGAGAKTVDFRF
jgi:hypothetical protein